MNEIVYLDVEDILTSHRMGMHEFGGEVGGVCKNCVEKIVVVPQTHYFGEEQYPGLFRKAALYWLRITTAHCFHDGNKRAGLISTKLTSSLTQTTKTTNYLSLLLIRLYYAISAYIYRPCIDYRRIKVFIDKTYGLNSVRFL